MKRQDKLELAFASLIAVLVIVSLIFAIAIVSPEQGILQEAQSTAGITSSIVTSVSLSTDTLISKTTQTASITLTSTQTSLIPTFSTQAITSTIELLQTIAGSSTSTARNSSFTDTTRNQITSQSASTMFSSTATLATSTVATTSTTSATSTVTTTTSTTTSIDTTTSATTSSASTSQSTAWGSTTTLSALGTSLSPSCSPSEFQLGKSTVCIATVTSFDAEFPATGQVSFSSTLPGVFSPPTCTLQGAEPTTCSSTFTPKGPATGSYTVTESYLGDSTHTGSSGSVTLSVAPAEPVLVSCSPTSVSVGTSTHCVVTVENTMGFPFPMGTVAFTSNMPGSFDATSCTLNSTGSCSVHYTPAKGSSGSTTVISGTYAGDLYHAPGSGTAQLTVS